MAPAANNTDTSLNPPAIPCSSSSFSELQPLLPELTNNMFRTQSKLATDNPLLYSQMNSLDLLTPSHINYNQGALDAIEHDHAFLSKRATTSTSSKRVHPRRSCRASTRLHSRAVGSASTESQSARNKRTGNINRATDIKTSDDLSYYLERRRKNNEASKMSRAARRQKFGDMDHQW